MASEFISDRAEPILESARVLSCLGILSAGIALVTVSVAAPLASAGQDVRVGANVPVVLDGSNSEDSSGAPLSYYWEQIRGDHLELIGHDRKKAMVLSASRPGTYVFRLGVSSGIAKAADEVKVTVVEPVGRTIYVDAGLAANCLSGNYSVAKRNEAGADGDAYTSLQAAANAANAGDTVVVRGGTYFHAFNSAGPRRQILLHLTKSGTPEQPIRFGSYPGEEVVLKGWGFEDRDLNSDGFADGPNHPSFREFLVQVDADYVQVFGFKVCNAQEAAFLVAGSFCYFEECVAYDNWLGGFDIRSKEAEATFGSVFRFCEAKRTRHSGGIVVSPSSGSPRSLRNFAIADCLSFQNGHEAQGRKVLPFAYDPKGGANSDGIAFAKEFHDKAAAAGYENLGPENFLVRNIAFQNADDGIDTSIADSLIEGNLSLANGPEGRQGFKMLREVKKIVYRGNLSAANLGRGYDLRPAGGSMSFLQNTGIQNQEHGIIGPTILSEVRNNLTAFNSLAGIGRDFVSGTLPGGANWAEDGIGVLLALQGDPLLKDSTFIVNSEPDPSLSVITKWRVLYSQISAAFAPQSGSGLIDKAEIIPGYHCSRADDDPVNPMPKDAPGRHWRGVAPDIGAFEYQPPGVQSGKIHLHISASGGEISLAVSAPYGVVYSVEQSATAFPGSWTVVASGQTASTLKLSLQPGVDRAFWRIRADTSFADLPAGSLVLPLI